MILSEQARRWAEIQFYYFCLDTYNIRHNMVDVMLILEIICQIADTDLKTLKTIAGLMMGDPAYLPHRDEVIILAHMHKMKANEIVKTLKLSRTKVDYTIKEKINTYIPFPQFSLNEDQELYKFNQIFNQLKKAGI